METIEEILLNQEDESGLSYWEFINNSDIVSDDDIATLSLDSLPSWNSSLSITSKTQNPLQDLTNHDGYEEETPLQDLTHHHHVVVVDDDDGDEQVKYDVGFDCYHHQQQQHQDVVVNEEEEEEDFDDDDDGDLDDELVPWNLSGKMGRNRMRKLGKRVCAKMTNAKRNPFRYVKPGCVHGKHGLGLNH